MLKAKKKNPFVLLLVPLLLSATSVFAAERLDLDTVLKRIDKHYPTLQIAAKQVERARQDVIAAQSQLGWNMTANAGVSHDASLFGTGIADATSMSLNFNKPLENGDTFSIGTNVSDTKYDPALIGLSTQQANDIVANYRMALGKGSGNPAYQLALNNSKAGVMMSQAAERGTRDQIGNQVIELFYGAAQAQAGLKNASDGLRRAEALVEYIKKNMRLGLAEEKDFLQFDAQLRAARVALKNAELMWKSQRTSLNRLMGEPWDHDFEIVINDVAADMLPGYDPLLKQAEDYNAELLRHQAELMMAEASLNKARKDKQNQLDLVMSLGQKTRDANTMSTAVTDMSYSVQIQYGLPLDKSGFDAKLYQAQIDKGIAEDNIRQVKQDLQYNINSMITDINASRQAMELSQRRLEVERERYADVKQRFKSGRVDNSQLILAEGDLSVGEFDLKQRQIDLAKRQARLEALRGTLWQSQQ